MAKSDSENSSSSSSSESDSDSSSSDEEQTVKDNSAPDTATSVVKKSSKKMDHDVTEKTTMKKRDKSSSESSSSSSSNSSSSSSSSSSDSESEEDEKKESGLKAVEPTATDAVPEVVEEGKANLEVSVVPPIVEQVEPKDDPKPAEVAPHAEPVAEVVEEENVVSKEVSPTPESIQELGEHCKPTEEVPIPPEPETQAQLPEPATKTAAVEGEEGEIVEEPKEVDKPSMPEATTSPEETPNDGEPEAKKSKLEAEPEKVSQPVESGRKSTRDSKDESRRRSPKDRSRSPDRRDRRRSRDRDERYRRRRSRSGDRRRRRSRTRSRSKLRTRDRSNERRNDRKDDKAKEEGNDSEKITERQRRTVDLLTSRTGGAYIPPAKLRLMQAEITDKASAAYQRIAWEALKKSIHGYINKVNVDNIGIITRELLKENIVRGRGLLCRSIIQAQAASPTFTHVYAALVAIINSKFPNIGELLLKRLVIQFKRAFRRNDKAICLSASRFVAHLVNQRVAHEILALEILTLLVETPTDDSVEVAIAFLKECGMKLTEVSSKGIGAIFEMLKNILHEGKLDKRVQYMIEVVFQVRKDGFKDHQSVIEALELVEEDDQFTHLLMLDEATNTEDNLNAFKFDDKYETNEDKYKGLSKEILGSDASDSEEGSGSGSDESDSEEDEEEKAKAEAIIDNTETNLVALRRTIYLTINSSLDYEECAHKLMKMQLKPGQEIELCHMFLDCCAEQRTYEKFYGLLAQRFCSINKTYIEPFEEIFKDTYQTTHRLDTNRLRNVSKFFAHLLFTDAIGWDVIDCIKLNEDDTTSSSRIFIKILFQELAEYMGLGKLNQKLKDDVLVESLTGLFPKDNPRNTRFAINFFTSIGLGGLTDDLRQFLKNAPKAVPAINSELLPAQIDVSSSSSSSSPSESSSSSSDSSSESSSSEEDKRKKKKRKKKASKKKVVEKSKKKKSKPEPKKKKSKKKHETSSSDSSSESSSSSSSSESSTSDSSSEDDKKKKKKGHSKKSEKKHKKEQTKEPIAEKRDRGREEKEKPRKRDEVNERISNGRSENGRGRDNRNHYPDERNHRERSDRRDNRSDRSPNRDRRYRDGYNQSSKSSRDHRPSGKSRNGSKERG